MLKFIKHHMTSIDGIEVYPIVSLTLFVAFFVVMGIYVWKMKKDEINEIKNYPLD